MALNFYFLIYTMKKIIIGIVFLLIVVVIGVFAYVAINADSLIAKYKPDLESIASKSVGSKVELGDISVSVFPSVKATVSEFRLTEGRKDESFSLKNLNLNLSLTDLLFGTVRVKNLSIDEPTLLLLKDGKKIRVAGLPEQKKSKAQKDIPATKNKDSGASQPSSSPVGLDLESVEINDATITLRDLATGKDSSLGKVTLSTGVTFSGTSLSVQNLSINGSVLESGSLSVSGGIDNLGGNKEKINLEGSVTKLSLVEIANVTSLLEVPLPIEGEGVISVNFNVSGSSKKPEAEGTIDLTKARVAKTGTFSKEEDTPLSLGFTLKPKDEKLEFSTTFKGDEIALEAPATTLSGINIGLQGTGDPKTKSWDVTTDSLALTLGGAPIRGNIQAAVTESTLSIPTLHLDAFNGTVDGSIKMGTTSSALNLDLSAATLDLGMLLSALKPGADALLTGTLSTLSLSANTILKEDPVGALGGRGSLLVINSKLLGSNIIGDSLRAISSLPFISGNLFSTLPDDQQQAMSANETDIRKLAASFVIGNKRISTNDFILESSLFTLSASGTAGFDAELDLRCKMIIEPGLSAVIVEKVKELRASLNAEGKLPLTVNIKGKAPALVITPDVTELLKAGVKGAATKALSDVLSGKGIDKKGLGGILGF